MQKCLFDKCERGHTTASRLSPVVILHYAATCPKNGLQLSSHKMEVNKWITLLLTLLHLISSSIGLPGPPRPPRSTSNLLNECSDNNGGCAQYCVDTYDSYFCHCSLGYDISPATTFTCPHIPLRKKREAMMSAVEDAYAHENYAIHSIHNVYKRSTDYDEQLQALRHEIVKRQATADCQIDLVLILDDSGSITLNNGWQAVKDFASDIVTQLSIGDNAARVGLVKFSSSAQNIFFLNTYDNQNQIREAIQALTIDNGASNTQQAIQFMRLQQFTTANGDRPGAPNVAVLLTAGASTVNPDNTIPAAAAARDDGITIFSIGVGNSNSLNLAELSEISSPPQQENVNWFTSQSFDALDTIVNTIVSPSCTVEIQCVDAVDVAIILDSSSQVSGKSNFNILKQFVSDIIGSYFVATDRARISLSLISTTASVEWNLNSFTTTLALQQAVDNLRYANADSNIAAGLQVARENVFTASAGDRANVPNVAILIVSSTANVRQFDVGSEASLLKAEGVTLIPVAIRSRVNSGHMMDIASSSQQYLEVERFSDLSAVRSTLVGLACPAVEPGQYCYIDLILILDETVSIDFYNGWQAVKNFASSIVTQLPIGDNAARIGLVKFSSSAQNVFFLNTYNNHSQIKDAIQALTFANGATNTQQALQFMHLQQFTYANGDRPGAPNVAVLLTAGESNLNPDNTIPAAVAARNDGIIIFSIGVGNSYSLNFAELSQISSTPQQENVNWFITQSFDALDTIGTTILSQACTVATNTDLFYCRWYAMFGIVCFCRVNGNVGSIPTPVNGTQCKEIDECSHSNGGCQQSCINTPDSFVCVCDTGFRLADDRTSCECAEYEFACDYACIPNFWVCDTIYHCRDRTDEMNCTYTTAMPRTTTTTTETTTAILPTTTQTDNQTVTSTRRIALIVAGGVIAAVVLITIICCVQKIKRKPPTPAVRLTNDDRQEDTTLAEPLYEDIDEMVETTFIQPTGTGVGAHGYHIIRDTQRDAHGNAALDTTPYLHLLPSPEPVSPNIDSYPTPATSDRNPYLEPVSTNADAMCSEPCQSPGSGVDAPGCLRMTRRDAHVSSDRNTYLEPTCHDTESANSDSDPIRDDHASLDSNTYLEPTCHKTESANSDSDLIRDDHASRDRNTYLEPTCHKIESANSHSDPKPVPP